MARYRSGLETRERILSATRDLLAEVGLEGLTLKLICERAGIGAGSFYNLFSSKEEVTVAVVRQAIAAVDPAQPLGGAGARATETLADLVDAYVAFITGEPTLARIYLQIAISGGLTDDALLARAVRHHRHRLDRFAAAIQREDPGLADEEARLEAEALLGALTGLAFYWLVDPDLDFAGHARRLLAQRGGARVGAR